MPLKRKFSQGEIETWSLDSVKEWLVSVKLEACSEEFLENNVDGYALLELTLDDVKGMVSNEKQRKTMKKALSSLPGNSISKKDSKGGKKAKAVSSSKSKPKSRGPLPVEPVQSETLPPQHPPSPGLPRCPPPPVPSGSSRPSFPRQGPPVPMATGHDDMQDTYEDPAMSFGDPGPDLGGDIYDCPDDLNEYTQDQASNYLAPAPMSAPPPLTPPPEAMDYEYEEDDQPIYDEGADLSGEDDEFVDSFSDTSDSEAYESPFEDGTIPLEDPSQLNDPSGRNRTESNVNIRAVMGKFFAHGIHKEQAAKLATRTSTSSGGTDSLFSPPPAAPDEENIIEDDIYDTVPDEMKEMLADSRLGTDQDPIDEDIYDIPPEDMPVLKKPTMKPPIAKTPAPPPPPESPPPPNGIMEDMYDIPSEVIEEAAIRGSIPQIYKPAAPPPSVGELGMPPGRPPKPMGNHSPFLPSKEPQRFNKPAMRSPIKAESKPPAPSFPPPPEENLPPIRPPKSEATKAPPPPPLPEAEPEQPPRNMFNKPKLRAPISKGGLGSAGPPARPPSDTKPKIENRAPSPNLEQGRKSGEMSVMDRLARFSSPGKLQPSKSISPHPSPGSSPSPVRKTHSPDDPPPMSAPLPPPGPAMKHLNMRNKDQSSTNKTQTPPTGRKFPSPGLVRKSNDVMSKNTPSNDAMSKNTPSSDKTKTSINAAPKINKPPIATKTSKISERMKMFEKKDSQTQESPTVSPKHTLVVASEPPPADKSPMSGRKINREENVSELMNKFGGSLRVTSPTTSDRSSPSPESKPFLPPKPSGSTSIPSSPSIRKQKPFEPPAKDPLPSLPSKSHDNIQPTFSSSPRQSRKWMRETPPSQEPEQQEIRASPHFGRKSPKVEESFPSKRDSPSLRRKFPSEKPKAEERQDEQETSPASPKQFVYKSYKAPTKTKDDPQSSPPLSQRFPKQNEPPVPPLPERPRPGMSNQVQQGVPKLPDRPPPSHPSSVPGPTASGGFGAPKLPDRNPPQHRPPFSPPSEPIDPPLPPRPQQQAFDMIPSLPSRPAKDVPAPAPNVGFDLPSRPPKAGGVHGSPAGKSWYHANLDRKRSEAKLKRYAKDGTYIVRDSTKIAGEYSLSLWHSGGVRHLRIRLREDKKFVLGERKDDEVAFDTVVELVEYHRQEPLHLRSGGDTLLMYECP